MIDIVLNSIGVVTNQVCNRKKRNLKSTLEIPEGFIKALEGIEEYSHIVVLYWMHKVSEYDRSRTHILPHDKDDSVGLKGVLATRMPQRPNPIGLSIVKLISRSINILVVENLDAFDGSPILDIKPYTGHPRDILHKFKSPSWAK